MTPAGWAPVPFNIHLDARQDVCGGAPLGANPLAGLGTTTLSTAAAAASVPSFSVFLESPLASIFTSPTMCTSNSDCVGLGGGSLICYDIVSQLIGDGGFAGLLPNRVQDAFAFAAAGMRLDGTNPGNGPTCTSAMK